MNQAAPKRILVADDSDTITTLLETALTAGGYEVLIARNGFDTYELGKSENVDLVILDHLMPGLLGLEIIERWRSEGIEVPVIVLSGVDDDRTVVSSLEVGAVDFVRKPFRLNELMARVKQRFPSERDS
ncbi:MAG TPA: response regulator transcription factor [Acidimicrobiia bacterium]